MVPHPGRESSKKASHSLRRRICTRPDNDDAPLDPYTRSLCSSGLVSDADQDAGFMTAPSGTTPCMTSFALMDDATVNSRLTALLTLLKSADEFHESAVRD